MSDYPAHVEIEPHVHLIRGENNARFPEANSLLIDDEVLTLKTLNEYKGKMSVGYQFSDLGLLKVSR